MAKTIEAQASLLDDEKPEQPQALVRNHFDLLALAIQDKANIDVIERLSALQERAMDRDAEMQFNEAMNAVQQEVGRVGADLNNSQTSSRYASFKALDGKLRPIYTKHGFSLSFDSGDSPLAETVRVLCYVSHKAGHTRKYTAPPMPSDGKGAKGGAVMSPIHATGSAMSYGARYLLRYIFNIAVGEDDDDGNGGEVDQDWLTSQLGEIGRCETQEGLQAAFQSAATKALDEVKDLKAYQTLKKAKNARKAILQKGGK
jgi:hypothetical protein